VDHLLPVGDLVREERPLFRILSIRRKWRKNAKRRGLKKHWDWMLSMHYAVSKSDADERQKAIDIKQAKIFQMGIKNGKVLLNKRLVTYLNVVMMKKARRHRRLMMR